MPDSAWKPCAKPGCNALTRGRQYCEKHRKPGFEFSTVARGSSTARGYDKRWEAYSKKYLVEHPWCATCCQSSVYTQATEVDHITPHKGDRVLFWDVTNHQPLCHLCHTRKTLQEIRGGKKERGALYWPDLPTPRMPVTLVSGPPGSGKSTYAREYAGEHDVIIDVDEIISALSGLPAHQVDARRYMSDALAERNRRLALLHTDTEHARAWVIATAAAYKTRCWWADRLCADIVLLDVDAHTCKRRILADVSRGSNRQTALAMVDKWHAKATRGPRDGVVGGARSGEPPRLFEDFWGCRGP